MRRLGDVEDRPGAREGRPHAAARQPLQPVAPVEAVLDLQRTRGNALVARWLGAAPGRVLQRNDDPTIGEGIPEKEAGDLKAAWEFLKKLDTRPASADEIAGIAKIAHAEGIKFLEHRMLDRIRATPNTLLDVRAGLAPKQQPKDSGGTMLYAKFDDQVAGDAGYRAAEKFEAFLQSVPKARRKEVRFLVRIELKIPYYESQREGMTLGVGYFLETLMHELALHGERYVDQIVRWRESEEAWTPTYERTEHQEHMYAGNPRYILLFRRLYEAAKAGTFDVPPALPPALERELETSKAVESQDEKSAPKESSAAVNRELLKELLEAVVRQLQESKEVYTSEKISAPEKPAAVAKREMLEWTLELLEWLEPAPAQSPQGSSEPVPV